MTERDLEHLTEAALALPPEQLRTLLTMLSAAVLRVRDALIVDIRLRFFPSPAYSDRAAGHEIAKAWQRYKESGWQRGDGNLDACPEQHVGKLKGALWQLTRIEPRPLKPDTIRGIVAICDAPRTAAR